MVALIALAIIGAISMLGGGNDGMWTNIETQVTEAMSGG